MLVLLRMLIVTRHRYSVNTNVEPEFYVVEVEMTSLDTTQFHPPFSALLLIFLPLSDKDSDKVNVIRKD